MKNHFRNGLLVSVTLMLGSSTLWAVCDGGSPCETPSSDGVTVNGWNVSSTRISGIKALNSAGPSGNPTGSKYWFAVTTADQGSSTPNGSLAASGTGSTQLGNTFTTNGNSAPGSQVSGGSVTGILGGTFYWVYGQACPSTTPSSNGSNCSAWAKINSGQVKTNNYPSSVFSAPSKPADASVNSIVARLNVPSGDTGDVGNIHITIDDLINPGNNQTIVPDIAFSGNGPLSIDNSMYTNGFKPNVKYQYVGHVSYPFNVPVPSSDQTVGAIWTTPVNPGSVSVSNITHCSADITVQNSNGAPSNPSYTVYSVCASGSGGNCGSKPIGGGPITVPVTNLQPGTVYNPNATALVGNGSDGTASGWNNSGQTSGASFPTLAWGGTFTVGSITTVSASFNVSGLTGAGSIATWRILLNGTQAASGSGDPTGSHLLGSLTPNTKYNAKIELTEASGCTSTLPLSGVDFTTTAADPSNLLLSAATPSQINASWSDALNPAGNTTYTVNYCTNQAMTAGCNQTTTASGVKSASLTNGVVPEVTYFVQVKANTVGGGLDSNYIPSPPASITMPNDKPVIDNASANTFVSSAALTSLAHAHAPLPESTLVYHWTVKTFPAGSVVRTFSANDSNAAKNAIFNFDLSGSYQLQLIAEDHNGDGTGLKSDPATVNVNPGRTPTTISLDKNSATVGTGNSTTFTATVKDQGGVVIAGEPVSWTVSGGGSVSPTGPSTTFTAGSTPGGPFTLTANDGGAPAATAQITVVRNAVNVSCDKTLVGTGSTAQCTAVVIDPNTSNPAVPQPPITWKVQAPAGSNTVDATGKFSAQSAGNFVVEADVPSSGDSGTTPITVQGTAPTVTSVSKTVFVTSATVSARGSGFNPESTFTYTWSLVSGPSGAQAPDITPNNNNAARDAVAVFHAIGSYRLNVTITDPGFNPPTAVSQTLDIVVSPVLAGLTACPDGVSGCPSSITIRTFANQTFSAKGVDQFGAGLAPGTVTWTSSDNRITAAGAYSSPTLGSNITVRARQGEIQSAALSVNLVSYDLTGAYAYPVPFKANRDQKVNFTGLGTSAKIRIFTTSGHKVFDTETTAGTFPWDTRNSSGEKVASGVYFYVIESPEQKKDGKLIIIQ